MGRSRSGHKHKMLAHTVSPSMRTKSRSVVMANEEMKGFLSEDRRFSSQVCLVGYGRRDSLFSVDGTSAFLSKAGHKSFFQIKDQPSPSSDHLIQKAILSPFKSKSQRTPPPDNRLPGPGAYSPYQTPVLVKRSVLPEGFYSAIAAPAMIVDPPSPGHGHYIRDFNGLAKHPTSTAVFASRTERISQHLPAYMRPDPGFYDTQIGPKQSFCRNHSTGWLPV
ncbi:O(6)-methylguanine-induced apoptosis 2 isoform X2 [Pungitius pungitius]|uniref:O(6)-methylguanine-induced apoptosis 2 isoform X2 n=1 Tax=Pungitius pungitius TaxID=134920 RepID=UPI002E165048